MMKIKIALRNVFRNGRRTLLNVVMIAGGIAAIVVYKGFSHHLISDLEELATKGQYGHLQVASDKLWTLNPDDTAKERSFALDNEMANKIKALPGVNYISGRISYFGLVSSGEHSLSAQGIGFDTTSEYYLRDSMPILSGRALSADPTKVEVLVGSGLQEQLSAKLGDTLTLLTYTHDGSVNAIDADFVGVFRTGFAQLDNSTFYTSLPTSQKLLDTDLIERLVVLLKDTNQTAEYNQKVAEIIPKGLSVKPWTELAVYYRQVENFHKLQNMIVQGIILLLALLAIANTVGMAISERAGEIGTIRAIGDTQHEVLFQFLLEGLLLGVIGGVFGIAGGFVAAKVLTSLHIPMTLPGASAPRPLVFDVLPGAFLEAFVLTCLMSVMATSFAAWRASRMKIVESLKRNI